MTRQTIAELEQRIRELETEVGTLRAAPGIDEVDAAAPMRPEWKNRSWAWTLLATSLVVIGALLAPVAVVASWTKIELTDTDRFVATYAPLASVPAVQDFVADETMEVIRERLDIPSLTSDVIDGLVGLGTPPRVTRALELLKGPAASGLDSLIAGRVGVFVQSDVFTRVWGDALRVTHTQMRAAIQNDPDAAVQLGSDGTIGVQLAPIIAAVKEALVDQGLSFASQIPTIDRTITVARSDSIPLIQTVYNLAVAAGDWVPFVSLALLALGVIVARRRNLALVWAAVALAITVGVLGIALAVGRSLFVLSVSPAVLPGRVSEVIFDAVVGSMRTTVLSVLVLAIAVAVVGWLGGPFATPLRLRGFVRSGASALRGSAEKRGITTGRVGVWIYAQRVLLRAAVIVIAAAVIVFVRPLSPALVIWTVVLSALVIAVLELVQRPPVIVDVSV